MKKVIAASAMLMAQCVEASEWKWEDATVNTKGSVVSLIESYTHNSWLGVWADPNYGCNPTLALMEFSKDDWKVGSVSGEFQVKIDDHPLWFVETEFVNDGKAVKVEMEMTDGLMDQFASGTEIIARAKVERSAEWTNTIKFRLRGSSEALNDVIAICLRLQNKNSEKWWEPEQEWQS